MRIDLRICALAVFGFAALLAAPARTDTMLTTGVYKIACSQKDDEVLMSFCAGYAQAVLDFAAGSGRACVPDGTRASDLVAAIEERAFDRIGTEGFPETQAAIMMALAIVNQLYPCNG